MSDTKFTKGEWKPVESTGDDLRKNVFPIPVREPSPVLFQLLGLMIEASKELSGMTEILSGQSPGANVPAESVLALIEQGLQVYSAVHKRIYRAQYKEFNKLRRLNELYLDQMEYSNVLDDPNAVVQTDFNSLDYDVVPVSDPNSTTMMQRLLKAKALLDLRGQGLNDEEIVKRYLSALDVDNVEQLMAVEQQPDPMEQLTMQKMQVEIQELQATVQKIMADTALALAKADTERKNQEKATVGMVNDDRKITLESAKTLNQIQLGQRQADVGEAQALGQAMNDRDATNREYGLESNNKELE